jgi:hypothetical protein
MPQKELLYDSEKFPGMIHADTVLCSSVVKLCPCISSKDAVKILSFFARDTYRIKGFLGLTDGTFMVDCAASSIKLIPVKKLSIPESNRLSVLYGHGSPAWKSIEKAIQWYPEAISFVATELKLSKD